jgi:hypothetical protein
MSSCSSAIILISIPAPWLSVFSVVNAFAFPGARGTLPPSSVLAPLLGARAEKGSVVKRHRGRAAVSGD